MIRARVAGLALLCAWLVSTGCMTLSEIPRKDFTARAERKGVRVETRDGLVYDFDWAVFAGDTLTGYRNRNDVEGPVDQVAVVRVPFEDVQRVTARELDWRRTGLIGGSAVATALAVGLHAAARNSDNGSTSSGGGGKGFNP
jgi:hypothetical protein